MKKYKSFRYLVSYLEEIYGPTLTEQILFSELNEKNSSLRIQHLSFRAGGVKYKLPVLIDWDWTRDNNGFHVTFFHLCNESSINEIVKDVIKEKLFRFGKISKNIYIYFNNDPI